MNREYEGIENASPVMRPAAPLPSIPMDEAFGSDIGEMTAGRKEREATIIPSLLSLSNYCNDAVPEEGEHQRDCHCQLLMSIPFLIYF